MIFDGKQRWFIALLLAYPVILIFVGFSPRYGFLALPRFGEHFYQFALPSIKALDPPRKSIHGYDGQFYLQIATDPTLQDPAVQASADDIGYRGQRIGLSALAWILGCGRPAWIAQVYSVLNFPFWCLLCWLIVKRVGIESLEQRLVVISIVWTAGSIVSLTRALTDLPAAALGFLAMTLALRQTNSTSLAAKGFGILSTLFKETGVLSVSAFVAAHPKRWSLVSWLSLPLMLVPVLAWVLYVKLNIGTGQGGLQALSVPGMAFAQKVQTALTAAYVDFPSIHLIEIIAPFCIAVQVFYVLKNIELGSEVWRFGAGFACLAFFLGFPVWETQTAFSRVLLPLTITFNLLLYQNRTEHNLRSFALWFWIGNIGLLDRAMPMIPLWLLCEWFLRSRKPQEQAGSS